MRQNHCIVCNSEVGPDDCIRFLHDDGRPWTEDDGVTPVQVSCCDGACSVETLVAIRSWVEGEGFAWRDVSVEADEPQGAD